MFLDLQMKEKFGALKRIALSKFRFSLTVSEIVKIMINTKSLNLEVTLRVM